MYRHMLWFASDSDPRNWPSKLIDFRVPAAGSWRLFVVWPRQRIRYRKPRSIAFQFSCHRQPMTQVRIATSEWRYHYNVNNNQSMVFVISFVVSLLYRPTLQIQIQIPFT